MTLTATVLGCGSSGGVPRPGGPDGRGEWGACDPAEPKNRRTRCSLLVRQGRDTLLIDSSPDLRTQLLAAGCSTLDGVLYTHDHADQTHGIDDLRAITLNMRRRVGVWGDQATVSSLATRFAYCFGSPPGSSYPSILTAHVIADPYGSFVVPGTAGSGIRVQPFLQEHGEIASLGYRIGDLAYSSDVSGLSERAFAVLTGVSCWIVDALRYRPHPSHAHVALALEWIARVRPRRAILTNLHVDLDYATLKAELPPGVEPAYDGMTLTV